MTIYPDNFKIKAFYKYPTCVVDRIVEYNEFDNKHTAGNKNVKKFFDELMSMAAKMSTEYNQHVSMDNKIAFEIEHKDTGTILYAGYKDNIYCIGLSLNSYMTGPKVVLK